MSLSKEASSTVQWILRGARHSGFLQRRGNTFHCPSVSPVALGTQKRAANHQVTAGLQHQRSKVKWYHTENSGLASEKQATTIKGNEKKFEATKLEDDSQLLSASVAHVLRVIKSAWTNNLGVASSEKEQQTEDKYPRNEDELITDAELAYGKILKERVSGYIEGELLRDFKNSITKLQNDDGQTVTGYGVFKALLDSLENAHGIKIRDPGENLHKTQLTVAELLSLNSTSFCNIIKPSVNRRNASGSRSGRYPEEELHKLRSLISHCLSYEDHVQPYFDQLLKITEEYPKTYAKRQVQAVTLYAIYAGAIHPILVAHPRAAYRLAEDLLSIINSGDTVRPLSLTDLQTMSQELRDRVPSLRMRNDLDFETSNVMRKDHEHLDGLYNAIHGALCDQAFKINVFPHEDFSSQRVIEHIRKILYILGGDINIASDVELSDGVDAISRWTTAISREHRRNSDDFQDMETVSSIVSALQEVHKVFQELTYDSVVERLNDVLSVHVKNEFPRLAREKMGQMGSHQVFSANAEAIGIARYLIRSPNSSCQMDGLNALAIYMEPFAMRHFELHKERREAKRSEQTRIQSERFGNALREYLRPYDKPTVGQERKIMKTETNLSLSHIGPIPPGKGVLVQEQLDRTRIQGGVYPLVVLIAVSGLGKTDILEQLSKYHFKSDGTLVDNEAELLLPLEFEEDIQLGSQKDDKRKQLEQLTKVKVAATMCTALAILQGHRNQGKVPPTPHELFRYLNNGGGAFIKDVVGTLIAFPDPITLAVVRRLRILLLKELTESARSRSTENADDESEIYANVSFAIDEVNKLAQMFQNEVKKSTDNEQCTGSMLTAVSHVLQFVGTTVYAGTGLRYSLIEEAVSAIGKDIIVMAPSLPPANCRTIIYMLHRLLDFKKLRQGKGSFPTESIEVCMLTGRMRFLELFVTNLLKVIPEQSSLSEQDCPDRVFCPALLSVGEYMTHIVKSRIIPALLAKEKKNGAQYSKSAFELAACGVMYIEGMPGDPSDAESILIQCGLVQLSDTGAHRSSRKGEIGDERSIGMRGYFFINREPIMQYALARALFDTEFGITRDLEEHIWSAIVVPMNDAHVNDVETLGWMLIRAMSHDQMLHDLLTGEDVDLGQYSNHTGFVWRDQTEGSLKQNCEKWLKDLEDDDRQDFFREMEQVYGGSVPKHQLSIIEDLWFHVSHLRHSDPSRAHILRRAVVLPPDKIGPDLIGSWSHKTNHEEMPLLMLMSCSGSIEIDKLRKDRSKSLPSNLGKNSKYLTVCKPLHDRRAIRFLLHPNVRPGENISIKELAKVYKVSEAVVEAGHGRDQYDNFVALLNRKTLRETISKRMSSTAEHPMDGYVAMVLRLWERYFELQDERAKLKSQKESLVHD